MYGLYKGKYLIVLYDKDEFPIIVASNRREFRKAYKRYTGKPINRSTLDSVLYYAARESGRYSNIRLVEADTVTHDCFEDADKDFIDFVKSTYGKSVKELCEELGITERKYFRWLKSGKIKRPNKEDEYA